VTQPSLFRSSSARFSSCRTYRYHLSRRWETGPACLWVMLNPSTADADSNDPTVERCERRARAWGFGAVEVVNLFALRSTDPSALKSHADPVGPENDGIIVEAAERSGVIVCAWGSWGAFRGRSAEICFLLGRFDLHALRVLKSGEPAHPLYLPYSLRPMPWQRRPAP